MDRPTHPRQFSSPARRCADSPLLDRTDIRKDHPMLPITDTPQRENAAHPGRTLVASHSFSFARREWIEAGALLSEQFRVVAVDAPGHGEAHDIPGYTMAEMAAQFAATINELGL